ncbi:MAG: hypothetical protein ACE5H1_01640 [Thermodesulfobacteriota bacterium]
MIPISYDDIKSTWLGNFMKHSAKYEEKNIPFISLLSGLSLISEKVNRNIYLKRDPGPGNIYPNIMVVMINSDEYKRVVGDTFKTHLEISQGKVFQGKLTCRNILKHFEENEFLITEDVTEMEPGALHALTYLYQGKIALQYKTMHECIKLVNCNACMFSSISSPLPTWVDGRVLFINPSEEDTSHFSDTEDFENLSLREMSEISGSMRMTKLGDSRYKLWYQHQFLFTYGDMESNPFSIYNGYLERKSEHVLKLAMILSVNESNDLTITEVHVDLALGILEKLEELFFRQKRKMQLLPDSL